MAIQTLAHPSAEYYTRPTVDHARGRQFRLYNVIVVIVMSLGASAIFGYSSSVIGMTLAQPTFIVYMGLDTAPNAADLVGLTTSIYQAGGVTGLVFSAWSSDRWGRKSGIAILGAFAIIGGTLTTASVHIGMFIAARFFAGFAGWGVLAIVPVWLGEVAAPAVRGILMDINMSIMATCGYVLSAAIGYGLFHLPDENNWSWRGPLIVQLLWPIILFSSIWFLPESPRWLMRNGRRVEAEAILKRLHQTEEAHIESIQIQQAIQLETSVPSSWVSMVTKKSYRKRTILAIYVCFSGQMLGTFTLTQYNPTIYGTLGLDTDQVLQYTLGYITFSTGMIYAGVLIIDRIPRHVMMATGLFLGALILSILCALIATYTTPEALATPNHSALRAAVAMVYLASGIYQLFYESVQLAFLAEIFPTQIRAKGVVLGVTVITLVNIMWLQTGPVAFQNIGWKFYLCFCVPSAICGVFTFLFVPNTLKMPLEEVNTLFGDYEDLTESAEVSTVEAAKSGSDSHVEKVA